MPKQLFQPGQSGNPEGRPKGAKSALKLLQMAGDSFTDQDLADVIAKVFDKAKEGDLRAIEMILDRTIPKVKPSADPQDEGTLAERMKAALERVRADREAYPIRVITGVPEPATEAETTTGRVVPFPQALDRAIPFPYQEPAKAAPEPVSPPADPAGEPHEGVSWSRCDTSARLSGERAAGADFDPYAE